MTEDEFAFKLEEWAKELGIDRTLDFIQFRNVFGNNYEFERVRELIGSLQVKRTGSRSTCWKVSRVNQTSF